MYTTLYNIYKMAKDLGQAVMEAMKIPSKIRNIAIDNTAVNFTFMSTSY